MSNSSLIKISASLMCCNILHLANEIEALQKAGCDALHIDIIDGHFAENFAMNFNDIKQIKKIATVPIEIHLLILHPEKYIDVLCDIGVDLIIVHIEACNNIEAVLNKIKMHGIKSAIGVCPETLYFPNKVILDLTDMFLILGVKPGFSGQNLIPFTSDKIRQYRTYLDKNGYNNILIQADGNINVRTISLLHEVGATSFVGGSSGLFCNENNYEKNINSLKKAAEVRYARNYA